MLCIFYRHVSCIGIQAMQWLHKSCKSQQIFGKMSSGLLYIGFYVGTLTDIILLSLTFAQFLVCVVPKMAPAAAVIFLSSREHHNTAASALH